MNIAIVDYGIGNIGSIRNMLNYLSIDAHITDNPNSVARAKRIILPGVGGFDFGMDKLEEKGLIHILNEKALIEKVPVLGICLGMQLMTRKSAEGISNGLGWLDAETSKFVFNDETNGAPRVPHMGWNFIHFTNTHPIINDLNTNPRFYFVHSYHVVCNNNENVIGMTKHGINFNSIVASENIIGCQFHPEKSHRFGMKLLENFNKL